VHRGQGSAPSPRAACHLPHRLAEPDREGPEALRPVEPGIGREGARHLVSKGVVAVGADTWAVEVVPFEKDGTRTVASSASSRTWSRWAASTSSRTSTPRSWQGQGPRVHVRAGPVGGVRSGVRSVCRRFEPRASGRYSWKWRGQRPRPRI